MKGGGRVVWLLPLPCYAPPRWEGRQPRISRFRSIVFLCGTNKYFSVLLHCICVCALSPLLFTVNYGILNQWSIVVLHQWPHTASCFHLFSPKLFLCTALAKQCCLPICCIKWYMKSGTQSIKVFIHGKYKLKISPFLQLIRHISRF